MRHELYLGIMNYIFDINTSGLFLPEFFENEYNKLVENHLSKLESTKINSLQKQNIFYKSVPKNHSFLLNKYQDRKCCNRSSKISQKCLDIKMKNLERKSLGKSRENAIKNSLKFKIKSKRWARRQHNWLYTYRY